MNPDGFMPHGYCFEWRPGVLWLHVISDLSIAIAYFGISLTLFYLVRKRRAMPFQLLFGLFSAFIILCGTTHLFSILVLWVPDYYLEGAVKAGTAIVSLATLVTLIIVLPGAMASTQSLETLVAAHGKELADANAQLRAQIAAREAIESTLRQSQKMEAIGQLTGGIAHDFNNMLQAISASMEMAQADFAQGRPAEAGRRMDGVRPIVDRASALTNRLLAYARRQPLQPRPVLLDQLVIGMEELLHRTIRAPSAPITFDLHLNDGDWAVLCDPNQLENALLNVVLNARDAMPAGGNLTITTRQVTFGAADLAGYQDAEPGDYIALIITDSGIGMDEATKLRVFEPFFTTKPVGQGTGLGLSQVYGFVRQSGGLVKLESEPGGGTAVQIFLRRTTAPLDSRTAADAEAPKNAGHAVILLVEDEKMVRVNTADYLRRQGYDVKEAEDSAAALALLGRMNAPDLLITDVGLTDGMNGRHLADIFRAHAPSLPVLFITGYAGAGEVDQLDTGMQILTKPFSLPTLAERVAKLLNNAAATALKKPARN